jgi:hypothetical protein
MVPMSLERDGECVSMKELYILFYLPSVPSPLRVHADYSLYREKPLLRENQTYHTGCVYRVPGYRGPDQNRF